MSKLSAFDGRPGPTVARTVRRLWKHCKPSQEVRCLVVKKD